MRAPHRLALLLAAVVLALAGCGSETETGSAGESGGPGSEREAFPAADSSQGALGDSVPLSDAAIIAEARDRIENICRGIVEPIDRQENVQTAVEQLVSMYRQYGPEIYYESGDIDERKLMDRVLRDSAEELRACGEPQAADQLLQAI